jgi:hypothetical protein
MPSRLAPAGSESFLPVTLFALLFFAALGAGFLWSSGNRWARWAVAPLALLVVWESRPGPVHVSAVRRLETVIEGRRPNPQWRVLVVPNDVYRDVDDTWQIAVDGPFVHSAFLQERLSVGEALAARFPRVYRDRSQVWDEAWGHELAALDVGYLILPDSSWLERLPPPIRRNLGMVGPGGVLVGLR